MARQRQEAKSEAAMNKALDAALELLSKQGFRATTMRQIAEDSGLSLGNLYHHFPNKEAIFQRLIDVYFERLLDPELPLNKLFRQGRFPEDLEELADAIEQVVEENIPYILLIYVDVIEFRGEHIHTFYEEMAARYQAVYGDRLEARKTRGELGDVDPLAGVMMASRWFFYFFTVEKCFGVPMHLGLEPRQAVKEFVRVLRYGLLPRGEQATGQPDDEGDDTPGRME
ncbi:MAG: TetR/AcrR family transcriptional regulator [Acidobacteriota bacterium]